jgi:hypothetical protein
VLSLSYITSLSHRARIRSRFSWHLALPLRILSYTLATSTGGHRPRSTYWAFDLLQETSREARVHAPSVFLHPNFVSSNSLSPLITTHQQIRGLHQRKNDSKSRKAEHVTLRPVSSRQTKGAIATYYGWSSLLIFKKCLPTNRIWPSNCARCKIKGYTCSEPKLAERKPRASRAIANVDTGTHSSATNV